MRRVGGRCVGDVSRKVTGFRGPPPELWLLLMGGQSSPNRIGIRGRAQLRFCLRLSSVSVCFNEVMQEGEIKARNAEKRETQTRRVQSVSEK